MTKKLLEFSKKHGPYKYLKKIGVEWEKIISKKFLPDDSIYVILSKLGLPVPRSNEGE